MCVDVDFFGGAYACIHSIVIPDVRSTDFSISFELSLGPAISHIIIATVLASKR